MLEKNVALSIRGVMAAWKARLELHGWAQVDNGWTGATLFWRWQGASGMFFRKVSDFDPNYHDGIWEDGHNGIE
ncbi:hypothetical protein, partial [Akkermansia sp.]|uniref:hypothetical protein n=1 Tax=Akkermansia sp. TaxID=1872421 RepID=UPI003AB22023